MTSLAAPLATLGEAARRSRKSTIKEFIVKLIVEGEKQCRSGVQQTVKQMGYPSITQEPGEIDFH